MTNQELQQVIDDIDYAQKYFPDDSSVRRSLEIASDLLVRLPGELREIWPDDPQFARELEQETADEAMRLSLGMGE